MELDDLRRGWRQPAPAAPVPLGAPLDAPALARLLAAGSRGPVALMRRNAKLEIGVVLLCVVGYLALAALTYNAFHLTMAVWMGLLSVLSGFYFRRKFALLASLDAADSAPVRASVAAQLAGLRNLLLLYYQATIWSLPVTASVAIGFVGWHMGEQYAGHRLSVAWTYLALVSVGVLGLAYVIMHRFTRWYLHRLYGQHLDRLEASLRELAPEPTPYAA